MENEYVYRFDTGLLDAEIYRIASVCHEANRAFCCEYEDKEGLKWDDTDQDVKESTLLAVSYVKKTKDVKAIHLHKKWMQDKLSDEWKKGAQIDYVKKEHPNLVDWLELHQRERVKYILFISIVNSLTRFRQQTVF